MLTATNMTII